MRWMRQAAMAAAAGLLGLMAAPAMALAGDADCLVDKLPAAGLQQVVARSPELGGVEMIDLVGGPAAVQRAMDQCGVGPEGREAAAKAVVGTLMAYGASERLRLDFGVGRDAFNDALHSQPPQAQVDFCTAVATGGQIGPAQEHFLAGVSAALPSAHASPVGRKLVTTAVVGYCLAVFGEAGF